MLLLCPMKGMESNFFVEGEDWISDFILETNEVLELGGGRRSQKNG